MQFFISQNFLANFRSISKKKAKYHCISKSLFEEFYGKSDEEIAGRGSNLSNSSAVTVIKKKRCKTCGNNGKSGGFRVLTIVNTHSKKCGLFMLYPKWGPLAKDSATKDEWKSLLTNYIEDMRSDNLLEMKFNKKTKEVYFE